MPQRTRSTRTRTAASALPRDDARSTAQWAAIGASILTVVLSLFLSFAARAEGERFRDVREDDREALEALATFPEDIREAALQAAAHPQLLARVHEVQRRSSREFQTLVEDLPREAQEKVWDLVRYPELVREMVNGGKKSPAKLRAIASHYPESIRETAVALGHEQYPLLVRIHALDAESERTFEKSLDAYPRDTQQAMRALVSTPEVLDLLIDNMHMSVTLGAAYRDDPRGAVGDLAALASEVEQREAQARNEWVEELSEDPEAQAELDQAAREYAEEYGYDVEEEWRDEAEPERRTRDDDDDDDHARPRVQVHVGLGLLAYPWWFGYPTWHVGLYSGYPSYYYWRPYHHGHHGHYARVYGGPYVGYAGPSWGFTYSSGHSRVYFGFPSFHFTHWYFNRPRHHERYPHLSHRILRHHERHPRIHRGGHGVARRWVRTNRHAGGRDWLADDGRRHDRLREYGRLEQRYQRARIEQPQRRITRREIVRREPDRYPNLRPRLERDSNGRPHRDDQYGRRDRVQREDRRDVARRGDSRTADRERRAPLIRRERSEAGEGRSNGRRAERSDREVWREGRGDERGTAEPRRRERSREGSNAPDAAPRQRRQEAPDRMRGERRSEKRSESRTEKRTERRSEGARETRSGEGRERRGLIRRPAESEPQRVTRSREARNREGSAASRQRRSANAGENPFARERTQRTSRREVSRREAGRSEASPGERPGRDVARRDSSRREARAPERRRGGSNEARTAPRETRRRATEAPRERTQPSRSSERRETSRPTREAPRRETSRSTREAPRRETRSREARPSREPSREARERRSNNRGQREARSPSRPGRRQSEARSSRGSSRPQISRRSGGGSRSRESSRSGGERGERRERRSR